MNPGVLLLFFAGFAFGEEPPVTKRDGETVTLHLNQTAHQSKDYLWTYGQHQPVLAITIVTNGQITLVNGTRFGNRLQTNIETASITISNLTVNDSGIFLVQVLTETGTLLQRFNLTVHDNTVINVNVLDGNNVTLDPGIKELQKHHTVKWTKGRDFVGTLIAQWKDFKTFINETFKDVLQLNEHTGALTFTSVTRDLAGYYCVKMLIGSELYILRQYFITVYELVPKPHITPANASITYQLANDGICYAICSVRNAPEVTLSWYKEEKKLNESRDPDISVNLTLPLQIQSQPEGIYICRAANPVSEETASLNSTQWCPPHRSDHKTLFLIVGAVTVGLLAVSLLAVLCTLGIRCRAKDNSGAPNCCGTVEMRQVTSPQDNGGSQDSGERLLGSTGNQ
ncbi:CD48 antigen-like [Stegastes partitus]|uniref:CD48 antigen-like n=1 Tax=Stegastes partitus TaxID=144197 RepID=A0A3B4Z743_9TELE|nr:PREDICTED: CD48 antigen-like [Stegastes partitus]